MLHKEIYLNKQVVGQATIAFNGLYAEIKCTCHFPDREIYAICLRSTDYERRLGTCIPHGSESVLHTKIPRKYIEGTSLDFCAEKKPKSVPMERILLVPDEPVKNIAALDRTIFSRSEGDYYLVVRQSVSSKQL